MATTGDSSEYWVQAAASGNVVVRDPPKFDLESYIANYEGQTRLSRLALISRSSTYLARDALRLALKEAKRGKDVKLYLDMVEGMKLLAPNDTLAKPDAAWVSTAEKRIQAETDRLEAELKTYKNNLIKESIRMGNEDLGQHYYLIGDYAASLKAYSRMREFCTTTKHIAEMSLKLLLVSVAQRNWNGVQSQALKIQTALSLIDSDKAKLETVTQPVLGLAYMASGNFKEAANCFLKCKIDFATSEKQAGILFQREILTANDVAVYGGLTALATMDRSTLQRRVLDNADFRQFLELEPHLRRAITMFVGSKYSGCLEILDGYEADWLLDIYLQEHLRALFAQIRSKSIVQYCIPYSVVALDEMRKAFPNKSGFAIEDELGDMIQGGVLNARLDLVDKLLILPSPNPRKHIQSDALRMAKSYERTLRLKLLRLNMQVAGLEVKAPRNNSSQMSVAGVLEGHDPGGRQETWSDTGGSSGSAAGRRDWKKGHHGGFRGLY